MEKLLNEMGTLQEKIDAANAWELDRQLEIAMDAMRLPPPDAQAKTLSGGERRRVALCKVLLQKPDLLLLDEPTNHLDAESVAWLERHLQEYAGTVVAVTHDRYFLDNVAQWILELDRGEGIPWKGNYSSWLEQKQDRLAKEERAENARRKKRSNANSNGPAWPRAPASPRARPVWRRMKSSPPRRSIDDAGELRMQIPPGPHLGDLVVRAENVKKGYGDNLLMEDLNFDLPKGGIVGIIGPNGAGKTTLFRMIMGTEKPDAGKLRVGDTVVPSYVDQSRDSLDGAKSVFDEISGGAEYQMLGKTQGQLAAATSSLVQLQGARSATQGLRTAPAANATASIWRSCCAAAATCCSSMSRPTISMSIRCGRSKSALLNFGGCAVVISHDRWFLDRIATHILAFEGDSKTIWHEGNYQTYEAAAQDSPRRGSRSAASDSLQEIDALMRLPVGNRDIYIRAL